MDEQKNLQNDPYSWDSQDHSEQYASMTDEELVRLDSHFKAFREIVSSDEAAGRKLDFLVQEINRETNTIGSKAGNAEIAHLVVDMKTEIEKIREQIQNLE